MPQSYVRRELLAVPLGDGRHIALHPETQTAGVLSADQVELLSRCGVAEDLTAHQARIGRELNLPASAQPGLADLLGSLARAGFLASPADVMARGTRAAEPIAPLSRLGVLTRGRAAAVLRCVTSFVENAAQHDRQLICSVVDTSPDQSARAATRDALRTLARRTGRSIRYAEPQDKERLAARLASEAGVDPAIARFALGDPYGCGHDTGANRNALLLAHAGQSFISADDDVVCDLRRPGSRGAPLVFSGRGDATSVRLFPDRSAALGQYESVSECALAVHERLLGRPVSHCLDGDPAQLGLDAVSAATLEDLRKPAARVAVTMTGILGDSGAKHPAFYLWRNPEMRTQLLVGDETTYRALAASREVARFVVAPTVSSGAFLMTTSCAFDARTLLPPFFPLMRGQDLNFGVLLRLCFDDAFIGHLPRMMTHLPVDERGGGPLFPATERPNLSTLVRHSLELLRGGAQAAASGQRRLRVVGHLLQELAQLPREEFDRLLRQRLWEASSKRIVTLQAELARWGGQPAHWAHDLSGYLDNRIAALKSPDGLTPVDLGTGRRPAQAAALVQELLGAFGSLLGAWPALFAAAAKLAASDDGLTRPL
jgi:hypothetical protein